MSPDSLALLGFLTAPFLGGALYLRLVRERSLAEGVAFGWGMGWILVNLLLLTTHQILRFPLTREQILAASAAFAVLGGLLAGPRLRRVGRSWATAIRRFRPRPWSLALWTGPLLLFPLLLAKAILYPATGPDAVYYHLHLAKEAFETRALPATAGLGLLEAPNAFPNLFVTQQIWIYFHGGTAAQLLSRPLVPLYALLLAVLLAATANRLRAGSGPLAVLLLASVTLPPDLLPAFLVPDFLPFGRLSVEIWTDVPVAFYALLSFRFLLRGSEGGDPRDLAFAGAFTGGAVLTKYNGLLLAAVLLVMLGSLALARRRQDANPPPRIHLVLASYLLPLAAVTAPLFLRNVLLFGNPVFPGLTGVFGGVDPRVAAVLAAPSPGLSLDVKALQATALLSNLLVLLFALSITLRDPGLRLLQAVALLYLAGLLLFPFVSAFFRLLLPVLPAMALSAGAWLRDALADPGKGLRPLLAVGATVLAQALQPSLHLAAFALALVGLAVVGRGLLEGRLGGRARRGLRAALLVGLSLALTFPALQGVAAAKYPTPLAGPLPVGLPPVSDEAVLEEAFGNHYRLWRWMNEHLPPDARVLTLDTARYYVEASYVGPTAPEVVDHYSAANLQEALDVLRAADIEYVLDSPFFRAYFVTQPLWDRSPVFQNLDDPTAFERVHAEGGLVLYRVTA